ncbi:hypothetical protein P4H39_13705 [Paenibacillus lautus]|uniref:hypothetical protein n=1 Tax=Paenibacillus lautus TaxID=1401 RepID=UPI002DB7978B|nr:hypothetical protein [Paenibacillus lautus]MEC0203692.1 hypothetical protein [Paenibacillus lautus]
MNGVFKARKAGLTMGVVALLLCIMLPGAGKVHEEITLHNEINSPYLYRIIMSFGMSKDDVDSQFGKPDIVRKGQDYTYEIREMADGSKLVSFFHPQGGYLLDQWRLSRLPERSEFEALVPGETHALDVKRIDPYFKLMADQTHETATSEHRLRDSGLATIQYKKSNGRWIVDSIQYMDQDPSGFVSKLRAEDRAAFWTS